MKAIVAYIGTGHGFKSPAVSIQKELEKAGATVVLVDFYEAIGARAHDWFIKESWRFCLGHPAFFNVVFGFANTFFIDIAYRFQTITLGRKIRAFVERENPDVIVSTMFISSGLLSRIVPRMKGRRIPCYGYNSDVVLSHKAYVNKGMDAYFVSTAAGRSAMINQGMPAEKTILCGFPVDQKYFKPFGTLKEERIRLGLDPDGFTVLVTLGGEGVGSNSFVSELGKSGLDLQVVVVCGKNETLKAEVEALRAAFPSLHMRVEGFVTNMQDWLYACDISVGKAGLNQMFESIYMKKPFMVIMAMTNETIGAKWLVDSGYGWHPGNDALCVERIRGALARDSEWNRVVSNLETTPCGFSIHDMAIRVLEGVKS